MIVEELVKQAITQGGALIVAVLLAFVLKDVVRRWQQDNDSARNRESVIHAREVETRDRLLVQIQTSNDKLLESQKEMSGAMTSLCDEIGGMRDDLGRHGVELTPRDGARRVGAPR